MALFILVLFSQLRVGRPPLPHVILHAAHDNVAGKYHTSPNGDAGTQEYHKRSGDITFP